MTKDLEIEVEVKMKTAKALLVNFGGKDLLWIAKSQISDYVGEDLDHAEVIFIPEWLAKEKGMI